METSNAILSYNDTQETESDLSILEIDHGWSEVKASQ